MEMLPQQKPTKERCGETVRLVCQQNLTVPEAARNLSMSDETVTGMDSTRTPVPDLDDEVSRLKRELAEVRIECDILRKTTTYFAKKQLPGGGL